MGGMKCPFILPPTAEDKIRNDILWPTCYSNFRLGDPSQSYLKFLICGFVMHASHLLTKQTSIIQFLDKRRMSFNEIIKVLCLKKK